MVLAVVKFRSLGDKVGIGSGGDARTRGVGLEGSCKMLDAGIQRRKTCIISYGNA